MILLKNYTSIGRGTDRTHTSCKSEKNGCFKMFSHLLKTSYRICLALTLRSWTARHMQMKQSMVFVLQLNICKWNILWHGPTLKKSQHDIKTNKALQKIGGSHRKMFNHSMPFEEENKSHSSSILESWTNIGCFFKANHTQKVQGYSSCTNSNSSSTFKKTRGKNPGVRLLGMQPWPWGISIL